jgi:hypothetical protein
MILVGANLDEAQIGDVVVEITHNGFYTHIQVWVNIRNGARNGSQPQSYRGNITTPHNLHRVSSSVLERHNSTPIIGDIWIP